MEVCMILQTEVKCVCVRAIVHMRAHMHWGEDTHTLSSHLDPYFIH